MYNYVISLTSADQRREHIKQEFAKKEVDFQFFDAITPEVALVLVENMGLNYNNDYLSQGELACLMSHVSLWKKAVDKNLPYIVIFEDDVYLGENANFFLNNDEWFKQKWDVIKLEVTQPRVVMSSSPEFKMDFRTLYELDYPHLGAGGYIISNLCAKKLLEHIENMEFLLPADEILFRDLVNSEKYKVFQLSPALCVQDIITMDGNEKSNFKSYLIKERNVRMKKEKHTLLQKLKRESKRLVNQLKIILFSKEIFFK